MASGLKQMKIVSSFPASPLGALLAITIILTWFVAAFALDQPLFASQKSRMLTTLGAANGELLSSGEWWRIATSQFLHVHFLHMLFNAGCIAVVGAFVEQRHGWWKVALVYFCGGSIGQIASVVAYPELVSSGASQALMALCGASLVMVAERRPRLFVLAIVAIQVALDIYVAQKIKAGHSFGFLAGLLIGSALMFLFRPSVRASKAMESAPVARPTREERCSLLAAHRRRSASEKE